MLSEEITRLIGKGGDTQIFEVEKGAIKKYADAVEDLNPLYWDEEYAGNLKYGSITAPPGFFGWPTKWARKTAFFFATTVELEMAMTKAGYKRTIDGGIEYQFFTPVRAGDTLSASSVIKDIAERKGRTETMAFVVTETTYTNQNGDLVAISRWISIHS